MIHKKGNKLNRLIWQELLLYGFESLWSLRELFGQDEGHMPDKWTVPRATHTRGLKRADKGGW